jgi:hypothetical protein
MQSRLALFTAILLAAVGCQTPNVPTGTTSLSTDFLPSHVGNVWLYSTYSSNQPPSPSRIDQVVRIVDTKTIEGNEYFVEVTTYSWTDRPDTSYYRLSGDSLIKASGGSGKFRCDVDAIFSLELGQTFTRASGFINDTSHYRVVVGKKDEMTITFFYDDPAVVDEEFAVTYKRGVGVVDHHSTAWGIGYSLIQASLE